ncbi:MAG: putative addiction module antidote protein [bacterium]|nr:putative addiction module antidote protein [bacterium]
MTKFSAEELKISRWDAADYLESPKDISAYLNEVLLDGDYTLIAGALGDIARSKGMSAISKKTGLNRANLYQSLNKQGDPKISTVSKLINSFGLSLAVVPRPKANA